MSKQLHIAVCEPSSIIYKGLIAFLHSLQKNINFYKPDTPEELKRLFSVKPIHVVLLNPSYLQNQIRIFNSLKKFSGDAKWIGLIYGYHDLETLTFFDDLIYINDSQESVIIKIKNNLIQKSTQAEFLTERENDVLKLLVNGKSNKEIADSLNLSVHTIVTHRKNITQKTGIKSVSGLTIYAVVNHLITL